MSKWEGFEEFVQVVKSGGFSSAARVLGVSKSHVSQQVSRLEDRLGSRLLHRTTRKISLTETGELYFLRCQQVVDDLDAAARSVLKLQEEVTGTLRISSPHLLGEVHLVPAIAEFLQHHPELNIELEFTSHKVDLLEENFDMAIQVGARKDVNVVNRVLVPTRFFVVASPNYLNEHESLMEPEDIKQHSCLLFTDRGVGKSWKFQHRNSGEVKHISVNSHWRSNSGHALRAAAKNHLGLAYLPDYYLAQDIREGRLVPLLDDWDAVNRDIVCIWQHKRHLTAKIRLFSQFMESYFKVCKL